MKQMNIGILLFTQADVLDFAGPYEVFNMATWDQKDVTKLLAKNLDAAEKPFCVRTVTESGMQVALNNGLLVQPDCSFNSAPQFDAILVPGGPFGSIKKACSNHKIMDWIRMQADHALILSVCTGAFLLAESGLLHGKRATTHHAALPYLHKMYPEINVQEQVRFTDEGDVMTSAGVSAGMDLALHAVAKLLNEEAAVRTASVIEYGEGGQKCMKSS